MLVSTDGEVVARAEVEHALSTPRAGWAEQDPEDWWAGAQAVLAALAGAGEIGGIGLTGQMHGLVTLDARGRVLRPAMLWNDGRTGAECAEIERRIGLDALIAQTGNRALPGFTAPKLRWLARHEPDLYGRIAHVLLPKDYVRLRLCGEHATDVADASGTLLFDVAARHWSEGVVEALGVDPSWLPRGAGIAGGERREGAKAGGWGGGSPSRRAPATRRRVRSASASTGRGRRRSCSARRASCSRRRRRSRPIARRACTRSAMPCPAHGMRWASCCRPPARCAGCATPSRRARRSMRSSPRPSAGSPASRG